MTPVALDAYRSQWFAAHFSSLGGCYGQGLDSRLISECALRELHLLGHHPRRLANPGESVGIRGCCRGSEPLHYFQFLNSWPCVQCFSSEDSRLECQTHPKYPPSLHPLLRPHLDCAFRFQARNRTYPLRQRLNSQLSSLCSVGVDIDWTSC